jgi:hypothetical protein
MMDTFSHLAQEWQTFFTTIAVCSATLMGLVFLAISLKLEALRGINNENLRQIAWQTFVNFFFVMMLSLIFLVPRLNQLTLSLPLLIIGATAISITVSQAIRTFRSASMLKDIIVESVPSLCGFLSIITIAILILCNVMDSLVWLLPAIVILLAIAVRNSWLLLISSNNLTQ